MRVVRIPKGNSGKHRTIYVPNREEKSALNAVKSQIDRRVRNAGTTDVIHGFMRNRSPVTNALSHVRHHFTLTMDLKDFFDSVTPERLKGKLSKELQAICLVDGAARQGLPTSPSVANLAAVDIDKAILKYIDKKNIQVVYTRYADDLTFSYDDGSITSLLLSEVKNIVTRSGFKLAEEKTHLYRASAGRRIVTGVAVDDDGVHPTRAMKRRLRAARHQGNKNQADGLTEWCKLKQPMGKSYKLLESDDLVEQAKAVAKAWNLPSINPKKIPDKGDDIDLGEGCRITGDPVMMLGMSTFTVGWTSCMSHPNGGRRRGTIYWMHIDGTRVAAYFSEKTATHGGVTRPLMKARALVHRLTDGTLVYDRIYCSDANDSRHLEQMLLKAGVTSIGNAKDDHANKRVVGEAPESWRAYFDNLKNATKKAADGKWRGRKVRYCYI